jgi:membrane-bound serine protease (ClpP class)
VEGALAAAGLADAEVRAAAQTWAETFVRFITDPIVASLLMSLGLLGIMVEIRTPGFGVPGAVGLVSLALFFWGHWIVRLAGWEELLLILAGVILLGLEVFVIPGFGIAGVAGTAALVAGLAMALVGAGAAPAAIVGALGRVALAILIGLAGKLLLLRLLPRLPFGRELVLTTEMQAEQGYASAPAGDRSRLGQSGTALSPLRPAGIAELGGARVDVVSEGAFIEAGSGIEVSRVEGNRIVVRQRPSPKGSQSS